MFEMVLLLLVLIAAFLVLVALVGFAGRVVLPRVEMSPDNRRRS